MVHKAHSYISNHLHLHPCMEDDDELRALESTLTQILSVVSVAESLPIAVNIASHHRALLQQLRDAAYEAEDLLDEFGYLLLRAKVESKIMGFLRPEEGSNTRMEDIGRIYFFDLLSRSFFQILEHDYTTYYVMHDMIHDLAQSVSKEECFRIEGSNAQKIPSTVRHLSINTDVLTQLEKVCELKNLRTLAFFCYDHFVPSHVFKELRSIRVLDLTGCDMERLPKTVGRLIHLRYLALCSTLATLPSSLCRLYNLQVLNTSKWCWSGRFPQNMNKLCNLRHLNVTSGFISQIAAIGRLTSLQGLAEFHVQRKKGHKIVELKDMNELRESLEIKNLENVKSKAEAVEAKLNQKQHIRSLRLEWGSSMKVVRNGDEVLEGLKPHPDLERLDIIRYYGINSPSWLETNWPFNLKSVILTNCKFWVSLPPLGQLPSLRFLKISGMKAVKQISSEFYGSENLKGFPMLEFLRLERMPHLLEWHGVEEYPLFPSLRDLEIKRCQKLIQIPTLATHANMSIVDVGPINNLEFSLSPSPDNLFTLNLCTSTICLDNYLDRRLFGAIDVLNLDMIYKASVSTIDLQAFTSLRQLKLSHCTQLVISKTPKEETIHSILPPLLNYLNIDSCGVTDEALPCCLCNLTCLSFLEIRSCHQLVSLPSAPILCQLTALKVLHIKNCDKLVSLGGLHVLTSLTELILTHCPNVLASTISEEDDSSTSLLPSSLMSIEINSCGLIDSALSKCLQNLVSLSTLKIYGCHRITSLPSTSVMRHLTALKHLNIWCCLVLTLLGGLQNLSSLEMLHILNCPQLLQSVNRQEDGDDILPPSIKLLELHSCGVNDNSLTLCLQNLTSLSKLSIEGCNNITSLPLDAVMCRLTALEELSIDDCKELMSAAGLTALINLRCLNIERCFKLDSMALLADLRSVSSLKDLNIMDGSEIQSLPDNGLPPSLEYFSLLQCHPELKMQILNKNGPDWNKISHISQIIC
uniref:Uncharacterized protein n=1 Tax=Ananas comosus var. bracteatus TaxID=296719 RepID=A0A6V7Q731_ANACO|nr:unnamed protein product [Ananas comosus var. bracteatus]